MDNRVKLSLKEAFESDYLGNEFAEYLLNNYVRVNRRGQVEYDEFPTYQEAIEDFDDRLTRREYSSAVRLLNNSNAEFYSGDDGTYLELSDNHTLWEINSSIDEEEYVQLVDTACEEFKNETGVDLYLLGRSGRHACVEINFDNFKRYDELKTAQRKWEKWVIDEANKYEGEEDE